MTLTKLFEFIASLCEFKHQAGPVEIKARLVWRDADGTVIKVRNADFGYCSGLSNELTVEMGTVSRDCIRSEDCTINATHGN